jgi:hypothetical protein
MSHPRTYALATLLSQPGDTPRGEYEHTASAIEALFQDYTDEQKADLYALLQEAVNATMSFVELTDCCAECLNKNEEHFRG